MTELTERQTAVLDYITDYIGKHHRSPTLREIMLGTDISSTSVVVDQLRELHNHKLIVHTPTISRGISLVNGVDEQLADRLADLRYEYARAEKAESQLDALLDENEALREKLAEIRAVLGGEA